MIITTIGDEIGTTLEEQIEALKEVDMKYIEIRKINDTYIWEYSEEEIKKIKEELEKNEIKVIAIDTPIGKKKNSFNYNENKKLLDKYIKIANIFNILAIFIFNNFPLYFELYYFFYVYIRNYLLSFLFLVDCYNNNHVFHS